MNSKNNNSKKTAASKKSVSSSKKSNIPSYQEYNKAIATIKESKKEPKSFNSPEELNDFMKHLQVIKVCQQAENNKVKAEKNKVDPVFLNGSSRCGGCTKALHNCECYENISDDAVEQINEYESKYRHEVYQHNETKEQLAFFKKISKRKENDLAFKQSEKRLEEEREENKRLREELELLKGDNERADDNIKIYKNKIKALEEKNEDDNDYETKYFNLLNKYNLLESDHTELKNKMSNYDYILHELVEKEEEIRELNKEIEENKETFKSWSKEIRTYRDTIERLEYQLKEDGKYKLLEQRNNFLIKEYEEAKEIIIKRNEDIKTLKEKLLKIAFII